MSQTERLQLDSISEGLNTLVKKQSSIAERLQKSHLESHFSDFLSDARSKLDAAQTRMEKLKGEVLVAAQFFCEKPDSFKLEELLNTFAAFTQQFVAAIDQNNARKAAARKAEERKKAMEGLKDKQAAIGEGSVVDTLLGRVQKGDFSRGMSKASVQGSIKRTPMKPNAEV